ncbi:MAG: hypothetical protein KF799_04725 [Bdellovibrionales bacterium]|nr:hypothetical protein [Bdellovibrionales bacterium]
MMKSAFLILLLIGLPAYATSGFTSHVLKTVERSLADDSGRPDDGVPAEPGFCETYEQDCVRDNDEDGIPDNQEEDGEGGWGDDDGGYDEFH